MMNKEKELSSAEKIAWNLALDKVQYEIETTSLPVKTKEIVQQMCETLKKSLIILLLLITGVCFGQYLPKEIPGEKIIKHTRYTLSYNMNHEQASWVAHTLTKGDINENFKRTNKFKADRAMPIVAPDDYTGSGFDRGHLSPSGDNTSSTEVNLESFYMTNMSPQLPSFNREVWREFEIWVRKQAQKFDTIYVVTGPIFVNNLGCVKGITIPGYYYKVLMQTNGEMIGFIMPHINCVGPMLSYAVPVNTIETLTGIDFYSIGGESKEANISLKNWIK